MTIALAKKNWIRSLLLLGAIALGLVPVAILGLFGYMNATKKPLHPNPEAVPSVARPSPSPEWADAVERGRQIARGGLIDENLPGLSVAVGVGGDIVWAEGFGWADLDDKVRMTPETRLRIGTAATPLTAAAAGLLLERRQLQLDDPIQTGVPEFPRKEWPVTLREVMGHTAGLRSDGGDEGPLFSKHCERPVDALPYFAKDPLLFEPGTRYRYSNYDWIVVGAAVEHASGQPFFRFMRDRIFEPLGMNDTRIDSATEPISDQAASYFPRFAADPRYGPDPMRPIDFSCYSGSSGILSTPSDLVRFAIAVNSGKFLQPATVQLLQTSQWLPSGGETGYGLGWDLETATLAGKPTGLVGHDGNTLGGMVASFMTFPEYGIVIAVASNTSYAGTFDLAVKIAGVFVR